MDDQGRKSRDWIPGFILSVVALLVTAILYLNDRFVSQTRTADLTPSPTHREATERPSPTLTATASPIPSATPSPTLPPLPDRVWYQENGALLYAVNNRLCLLTSGSNPVYVGEATDLWAVSLAPDQGELALLRMTPLVGKPDEHINQELWIARGGGSQARLALAQKDIQAFAPEYADPLIQSLAWIPGTRSIAFTMGHLEGLPAYNYDLHVLDTKSGAHKRLLAPGDGGMEAYPSPDGKWIAIVSYDSISLIRTDGSEWRPKVVTYEHIITGAEYFILPRPMWQADSTRLWAAIPPTGSTLTLWAIPMDGSPPVESQYSPVNFSTGFGGIVVFSPDGLAVAYTGAVPSNPTLTELHILTSDGNGVVDSVYTTGDARFVGWEPDSRHFVFWIGDPRNLQRGVIGGGYEPLVEPELPEQGCAPKS